MISGKETALYNRSSRLLGMDVLTALSDVRVILFGVGGVGSWCAEGLVRAGVKKLTIVDSDLVCITNINRQLEATSMTVGQVKVEALKKRLLEINPEAEITALQKVYSEENHDEFHLDEYDYIVDAVDSLKDKISLILRACETQATFFSSMGAALKVDPTRIRVAEFWDVNGCPLGSIIRKRMRQAKTLPAKKFLCVYDDEVLENRGDCVNACEQGYCSCDKREKNPEESGLVNYDERKKQINGSLVHITSIFGMTLCGLIVKDIYDKVAGKKQQP